MNIQELHKKYQSDPPEGHLCERCQKRPCEKNEYGRPNDVDMRKVCRDKATPFSQ